MYALPGGLRMQADHGDKRLLEGEYVAMSDVLIRRLGLDEPNLIGVKMKSSPDEI